MANSAITMSLNPRHSLFLALVHFLPLVYALNGSFPTCEPLGRHGDGLLITSYCVDPIYNNPIIDSRSNETVPGRHLKISGHFENTNTLFNFYFPPKGAWDGRFFQHVYPVLSENATDTTIDFGLDSRAYTVQVTGAQGYRAEAAAAKFSRVVARQYYGTDETIFGYIYGASGGSMQTVGAIENTIDVWQGGVPMVQGIPVSVGITQTMRPMLGLVLQNKSAEIQNALKPGGSGDAYSALNKVQKEILREIELLGFPLRSLEDFDEAVNSRMLSSLRGSFLGVDAAYREDFWTREGYLGAEKSPLGELMRNAVIDFNATVAHVERNAQGVPTNILLNDVPEANSLKYDDFGYEFTLTSSNGTTLGPLIGRYNQENSSATFDVVEAAQNDVSHYSLISPNTILYVSTRDWVALHGWYRYQVPSVDSDRNYIGYDHMRAANGSSIYPVRPVNVAQTFSKAASGGSDHSGNITGKKMIVLQNLLDFDALPWWAHWYAQQVRSSLGEAGFQDSFRLWYQDNADHVEETPKDRQMFIVDYESICQQALRDLSAWVEKGIAPSVSTTYNVTDRNGIAVPDSAAERRGIQPLVDLKVFKNGTQCDGMTTVRVGEEVLYEAVAEAPPRSGLVVDVEWDFYSVGEFEKGEVGQMGELVKVQKSHAYEEPGEYVAVVRATTQREEDAQTPYGRVKNLGRVRVRVV